MILSSSRIANKLRDGSREIEKNLDKADPLIINPEPDLEELEESGAASVDLRLGTWFLTLRNQRTSHLVVQDDTTMHPSDVQLTKLHYVPFGRTFILHPRSFVLAATLEWIRIPSDLSGYVIGRSSWGRRGLIIATATGVHPGFTGCLTLELSNVGEIPIEIRPGMAICQLFLHTVDHNKSGRVDQSPFVGYRRPILGEIKLDALALKLARGQAR